MRTDSADRLRALARDHLEGRLSLETYRKLRAQLLDGLLVPDLSLSSDPTKPRAPTEFEITTQPRMAARRFAADLPRPAPQVWQRIGRGRIAGLAALGLVLAAAIVFLVWFEIKVPAPQRTAGASGAATSLRSADPIRTLLEPLLKERNWSNARLLALNDALLKVGPARISAERNSDWFNAVVDRVRTRLREQQALAGAPLTPATSPLAALARTLGIGLGMPGKAAPMRKQR